MWTSEDFALPIPASIFRHRSSVATAYSAFVSIGGPQQGMKNRVDLQQNAALEGAPPPIAYPVISIDTQFARLDEDLRGPDFFDVKNSPAMTYRGRGIRRSADGAWGVMDGSLSIRGVTKEVSLTFRFKGMFPDMPAGKPARASFHATAAVKPGDFGMTRDNLMELGPNPNGPDVEIEIDVEANASTPAK